MLSISQAHLTHPNTKPHGCWPLADFSPISLESEIGIRLLSMCNECNHHRVRTAAAAASITSSDNDAMMMMSRHNES